ncbi:divergent polysaccharide deacetylase family protein [Amphritea sp. HPY]|uniref:divergent polysaccharide deacetylase family protein n=1 Tax=Amphritea sp. HPY TaxID=3421652 RepID=UPI003D7CB3B3
MIRRFYLKPVPAIALGLVFALFIFTGQAVAESRLPRLILIIDDIGDNLAQGVAAVALPGPVAYSVLPHTPHSKTLARMAHSQGKEVMLHVPMANTHNRRLGPGALTLDLDKASLQQILKQDIAAIPYVSGVNNHMGSLLTQRGKQMSWVMDVIAEQGLFFLDSVTTAKTTAWKSAYQRGVPWMMRDVFLDHEQTTEFVDKQFRYALRLARQQGFAVLIGHPYPVTVSYLAEAIPMLGEQGIQLVAPSGFLFQQAEARRLVDAQRAAAELSQQSADKACCKTALAGDGSIQAKP